MGPRDPEAKSETGRHTGAPLDAVRQQPAKDRRLTFILGLNFCLVKAVEQSGQQDNRNDAAGNAKINWLKDDSSPVLLKNHKLIKAQCKTPKCRQRGAMQQLFTIKLEC